MAKFKGEDAGQILLCILPGKPGLNLPSVFLLKLLVFFILLLAVLHLHQNEIPVPDIK
jgi:hypothetical protein